MGLLDDAIREHLDLKRRHGAAEEELHRQETEALGPARRDFSADGAPVEAAAEMPTVREPDEAVQEPADWLGDEPGGDLFDAPRGQPAEPVEQPTEPVEHATEAAIPPVEHETPPAAQEPVLRHEDPPRPSDTPPQGFPTVGREAEPADDAEDEGEDVLEETPEFLQDTPEHDRLWFEQKPPRDFDFDD